MKPIYRCRDGYSEEPGEGCVMLLDPYRRLRLSKLMSALLRHVPQEAGLILGEEGWVSLGELARAIRERWRNREAYSWVTEEHVIAVGMLDPKGRFEVRDGRIRARYGHSVDVRISYPVDREVEVLFHGTVREKLGSIRSQGLVPMRRLYVHLSPSVEAACEAASRRRGIPVCLVVDASCLRKKGLEVYRASETVYLARHVPPECIREIRFCKKD